MPPAAAALLDNVVSDLVLKETDLESKHLSHESVSSLFKTWQHEDALLLSFDSPTSVRQVLEEMDGDTLPIELPPLASNSPAALALQQQQRAATLKRPLCKFYNFRGSQKPQQSSVDEEVVPSLGDEPHSSCLPDICEKISLELPKIDKSLKDDDKMKEYVTKFQSLVKQIKKVEKDIEEEEAKMMERENKRLRLK